MKETINVSHSLKKLSKLCESLLLRIYSIPVEAWISNVIEWVCLFQIHFEILEKLVTSMFFFFVFFKKIIPKYKIIN